MLEQRVAYLPGLRKPVLHLHNMSCFGSLLPVPHQMRLLWQRQHSSSFAVAVQRTLQHTPMHDTIHVRHPPHLVSLLYCASCPCPADQLWWNDPLGRFHPYVLPGKCLTLPNSATTNGQVLEVQDCINTAPAPSQRWSSNTAAALTALFPTPFNPQNNSLQSRLQATTPPTTRCIEDLDFNTTDGAPIATNPCNSNSQTNLNQKWSLTVDGQLTLIFNQNKCMQAVGTGAVGKEGRGASERLGSFVVSTELCYSGNVHKCAL